MLRRRLENISSFLSFRDASIRTKVILAFLGVLLLILPQIVLTVTYMVDLFEDGENVERSSSASLILGKIHTELEHSFLVPYPATLDELATHERSIQEVVAAIEDAEQRFRLLQAKDVRFEAYVQTLVDIRQALDTYVSSLNAQVSADAAVAPPVMRREVTSRIHQELDDLTRAWDDAVIDTDGVKPETAEDRLGLLRKMMFQAIKDVVAAQNQDDASLSENLMNRSKQAELSWAKRRSVLRDVGELRARVNGENALAAEEIKRSVDEANRYLITLVLLTLVYIFVVVLVLPSRLVRPLAHFTSVIERAATGQLDVRARVVGDDEMGDMGRRLNTMLERLGTFDRLKRDRIYEDGARIKALGDRITTPVAILDTSLAFEYANSAMLSLLNITNELEGRELVTVFGGTDARDLVALLDKTLKRRRSLEGVVIELETKHGLKKLSVGTEVGRNRAGQISYLILTLDERS